MTGIWRKDGDKWSLVGPSDYSNEEELHDRIVEAPEMLPLSGQPEIVAAYREVPLGGGSADVLAFEASGRPVVIEVKLSRNAEARRAVVAQALAYAAALHGATVEELETGILGSHLRKEGRTSLANSIEEDVPDSSEFYASLEEHLAEGSYRIVFVLDEAPAQLVTLAGYLEVIADRITVDLVTVSAYEVNGTQILLPQRVDPEHAPELDRSRTRRRQPSEWSGPYEGSEHYRQSIEDVSDGDEAALLRRLADWGDALQQEGISTVESYSKDGVDSSLYPYLLDERVNIAFAWNYSGSARLYVNGTVVARRAPRSKPRIEEAANQEFPGNQMRPKAITDELLDALADAYREAARKD